MKLTRITYCLVNLLVLLFIVPINAQVVKLHKIRGGYRAPESAVFDSVRKQIYVSNFTNPVEEGAAYGQHSISRANADGDVIEIDWITGLTSPTGICIHKDSLYIVERFGIVVYDLDGDKIATRHFIKTQHFLNDVTVDQSDNIYVSVTDRNIIYKITGDSVEVWLNDTLIANPNGLLAADSFLLVGSTHHSALLKVNLNTREIKSFAAFPSGTVDGIKEYPGGYLVSIYEGELYLVDKAGKITHLMNTRKQGLNLADFEYIGSRHLLVIPALWNNKLLFYKFFDAQ